MSKISTTIVISIALLCGSVTVVAESGAPGSGPNPFSDCGIGAAIFPTTPIAAVTSNIIWDVGTTAVTSATASPETCSGQSVKTAAFIYKTYDSLVEETAKGSGEHLNALINILGADAAAKEAIISELRHGMVNIINSANYGQKSKTEKSSDYYTLVTQAAFKHS